MNTKDKNSKTAKKIGSAKLEKKQPKYIVDCTNIESPEDVIYEFIAAKVRANIAITEDDLESLVMYGAHLTVDYINQIQAWVDANTTYVQDDELVQDIVKLVKKSVTRKTSWYKRFWNWVKKPFAKK